MTPDLYKKLLNIAREASINIPTIEFRYVTCEEVMNGLHRQPHIFWFVDDKWICNGRPTTIDLREDCKWYLVQGITQVRAGPFDTFAEAHVLLRMLM